ncbi:YbjQ family protein [Suipraeoptans intestinalis]|uniref:UPF0145 protein FYJ34_02245 n=1 Tax=Suipraeoptans intestinalis TaxID=2606628 RepID=A0A6N7UR46_9FIRM|nr:YbjQ family protein [Suipraeoptans intestinalis]MDD7770760.1 YbjQ family protein [Suipraeoptans intestinalis]MDY3122708.1 YbjQ family protein [Suipraeoptans intestinalis]MSR93131.1 YbjQ family protein [Suipraeoptans intestinalis]
MILVNTDYIPGKKFEIIGLVRGTMVQSVHIGKDILNSFKTIVGGELTSYTEMMNESRATATRRMAEDAASMGADAVINIRYASSQIVQNASEVMAYGTAVKFVE